MTEESKVVTLEGALNECSVKNGEKPLSYFKGKELAHVSAYMAIHQEVINLMYKYLILKKL
jgi:ABC-type cobalamin transport system ATPase subunit